MFIIEASKLTKVYKNKTRSLTDVTLNVKKGSITGLIGENGAGKSTFINILTSLISKSSGTISLFGKELNEKNSFFIKKEIGFVGSQIIAYEHLNVLEYWKFISRIYKTNANDIDNRIEELLDILELGTSKKKLMRDFSKGMKQKALLGGALIHNPSLLILDEPLDGIDPPSRIIINNILKQFNKNGVTILISSHDCSLIEDICTDIIVIREGKIAFNDSAKNMHTKYAGLSLEGIFIKLTNKEDTLNKKLSWGGKNV
ncbi:ABC transporter ATP-binding protein (plasmid) [Clostridium estertheticum]|uniref:ABC transporter ATP-binding protein n=1 Tax=Clostridium estertheticum TaxID=238834 RepID=UPI001C7CCF1B|nr:ABC transporter ATP-binding protein [Clostridium estertheticum]MBX4260433.1 ABC transporter ATP-binding protein [Clostridium estertheticum]WLC72988.1 ABC transporter ATP-binding protein [Clostridium estertheticum]